MRGLKTRGGGVEEVAGVHGFSGGVVEETIILCEDFSNSF